LVNMDIVIRRATPDDCQALSALSEQLGYQATEREIRNRLEDMLVREDQVVFVAEEENQVRGWIHGYFYRLFYEETSVEIGGLVVDKDYRKRGIGKELIKALENWARLKNCRIISLRSNIKRTEAHKFYRALGYNPVKTQYRFIKNLIE